MHKVLNGHEKEQMHTTFVVAHIFVTGKDGKTHALTMFNDVIKKIIGEDVSQIKKVLLATPPLKFNVERGDIVFSVQKL